jgi:hypothetical protein
MTMQQVIDHQLKHFGQGGESRNVPSGTVGVAKAEAAPVAAPACPAEAIDENGINCEDDQHAQLIKWADGHRIAYRHSPMHAANMEGNGEPDFLFLKDGKCCFVEMKFEKGKPTNAQRDRQAYYLLCGVSGKTFWTVRDAIAFVTEQLLTKEKK